GALPLPFDSSGKVLNVEVLGAIDHAVGAGAPADYDKFTFTDRQGYQWIYRGAHNGGSPSYGMKFYYTSRAGFFIPSLPLASQPVAGTVMPFIADIGGGISVTVTYLPKWPDDPTLAAPAVVPTLATAQTLTLPTNGLPQVFGQTSAQVQYQQSIANTGLVNNSVLLHDPTRQKITGLDGLGFVNDKLPKSVLTSDYAGKTYFQGLPPNLQQRFYFDPAVGLKGSLVLIGQYVQEIAGLNYLNLNALSDDDIGNLKGLCPDNDTTNKPKWDTAINNLSTQLQTFSESKITPGTYIPDPAKDTRLINNTSLADIRDPDTAVDNYALSATGKGVGYVTLVFGNGVAFTDQGEPVAMQILKVDPALYTGELKVLLSSNPLDEQVTLRHSSDYAGHPELYEFQWRYGFPTNGNNPPISGSNIDIVADTSYWINPRPGTALPNQIVVGGSPTAAISNPAVLMGDTWFTMAYRLKTQANNAPWSNWMPPKLVEGWIKRVLARITPFNQRMTDLYNNSVNTDVSLITQAGKRWEGDIALNLNNINNVGLIEIYETVLNRGKSFTIGSGIDFNSSNNALILAAGYLNDLYNILGNEAYADAANPTVSVSDQGSATEINTSRFSFEGQVSSFLDEELGLLRGRDDFPAPGVGVTPVYNRLFWNFTRGINSGEAIYALNYNIKEKAGGIAEDGVINEADAALMFPQGHGDAYGHYLTALQGYYKLLTHPYFSWQTSSEAVTVAGQAISVDYKDERKFAASAVNLSRSAQQIISLVHRQVYKDDPATGWSQFRDGKVNPATSVARNQGLDEWVSRSEQGNFFHWVVCNSLLPEKDANIEHTGVQVIDRTTVPELAELATFASTFQNSIDSADAHLNPLGLSPGAIPFDISPAQLQGGQSHFDQVYGRALNSLLNAKGAFNQAATMTRLLRNQSNQVGDENTVIVDQEGNFDGILKDIYGTPYGGDIGPGKTYAQGYDGPDLFNWFVVDRPSGLVDTSALVTINVPVPTEVSGFSGNGIADITTDGTTLLKTINVTLNVHPSSIQQWSDTYGAGQPALGTRPQTGRLQQALIDSYSAQITLLQTNEALKVKALALKHQYTLFNELVTMHAAKSATRATATATAVDLQSSQTALQIAADSLDRAGDLALAIADAVSEAPPKAIGLATDATSPARAAIKGVGAAAKGVTSIIAQGLAGASAAKESDKTKNDMNLDSDLDKLDFTFEEKQSAYDFEQAYRDLVSTRYDLAQQATDYQRTLEALRNTLTEGQNALTDRETFRKRAAAIVAGYRTNDLAFRAFRDESLEQYRTLFDLASRYTYLAAKSYDYETGLLGSSAGQAVLARIVAARSLGDLTDGQPQATVSTLGDAGLAGTMAQLNADYSVVKGRLGINNPDPYGTVFSLRGELFRIRTDAAATSDDDAWKQTLQQYIVPDVMADADVAKSCNNIKKADGTRAPGIIIPFGTTIQQGLNFFGLPLAAGDHTYSSSSFSTKISSVGLVLKGYVGMDAYAVGGVGGGAPASSAPNALSATPYVYLIPCGSDFMLSPPLGDTNTVRAWTVHDQAMPLPFNLGASAFNTTQFFTADGSLTEQPWILRKHQAFRPVSDPAFFYSSIPAEFTNSRLVARSVWNGQWKLVIPAYTLLSNEQDALDRLVATVTDIQLFLRTYSYSGN
ncbi:MAG: hypothetical protein JWO94_1582, partial [Verrucomicrobiaceae bacterium]|nr:hypothetical protein [Verrucomicrobiaceae bacterium]